MAEAGRVECVQADVDAAQAGVGLLTTAPSKATLTISSCTFDNNTAGGFGGGLSFEGSSDSSLTNVTISGNSASRVGGLAGIGAATITLVNNTIAFNVGTEFGGGVSSSGAVLRISDTIVAKNITLMSATPDVDNNSTPANGVPLQGPLALVVAGLRRGTPNLRKNRETAPVSYTHLTLPTILLV